MKANKIVGLILFFATAATIAMEAPKIIILNEAWGYSVTSMNGWSYYDIKVSVNDTGNWIPNEGLAGTKSVVLPGNLFTITHVKIRRSGAGSQWIPSAMGESSITQQELNEIRTEMQDNPGSDLVLVIGATSTGFGLYNHFWKAASTQGQKQIAELPTHMRTIFNFTLDSKNKNYAEIIESIVKRDSTKDKKFQKTLLDYIQNYKAGFMNAQEFETNLKKLSQEIAKSKTLPRK